MTVKVSSTDETETRTYKYTIEPDLSQVCVESAYSALSSLTVSGVGGSLVSLSPAFDPAVRSYVAWMSPGTAGITVSTTVKNSEGFESSESEQTQRKEGRVLEEGPREGEHVYVDRVKVTTRHNVDGSLQTEPLLCQGLHPEDSGPTRSVCGRRRGRGRTAGAELRFKVELRPAQTSVVTVDYGTADVTAKAGLDYTETSGRLTFGVGETTKTVWCRCSTMRRTRGSRRCF